jgi:5-methyltetrahydropteroyltriglutamate--homocysteine methyltransferase
MTELVATTPGLYPLPDDAKAELADLKGHQKHDLVDGTEGEDVEEAYDGVRSELVAAQQEAGLDRVVEGQARWDDMLAHPLAVHDAVETRGIVRYYDNNNFYRDPVVTGELAADGGVVAELEAANTLTDDLQAVLPGPYTLSDLATDEHYGDEAEFLDAVTDFLAGEAAAFPAVETLFLLEPSLVADPPESVAEGGGDVDPERVSHAVDRVARSVDADVVVHTYWGALEETVHAHLLDADVDAVGYDLVNAPERSAYLVGEYGTADDVALGLVDGQNTHVESADTIRERVAWFDDRLPTADFDRTYLTSNTELYYLPVNKLEAKLAALAEAADAPAPDAEEVQA